MLTMRSSADDVRMTYVPADNMQMMYMPADNVRMTYLPADNVRMMFWMTYVIHQPKTPMKSRSHVVHMSSACHPCVICMSSATRFQPQNISSQRAENSSAKKMKKIGWGARPKFYFVDPPLHRMVLCTDQLM